MRIVRPNSPDYDASRKMVNQRINRHPAAILFCENETDVQQAVLMAKADGKTITIRSTGHSYEGFSIGESDTYMIDVRALNDITIDATSNIASIGSGAQLYYDVYLSLWNGGKFVIPGGSCPTVGVTGLFTGGGFSFSGRKFGLTCDSIVGFDIVTADGVLRHVDANNFSDLFWACRGGGNGNFGVITSLQTRLYPADDVSIYKISWKISNNLADIAQAWKAMLANTSPNLMPFLKFSIGSSGALLSSFGQYYGNQSDLKTIIDQYLAGFGHVHLSLDTLRNIDAIAMWGGVTTDHDASIQSEYMIHHLRMPKDGKNVNPGFIFDDSEHYFKASSIMLDRFFNQEELQFLQNILQSSSNKPGTFIVLDGQQNGHSSTLPDDYNAYAHRKAIASVQIYTAWTDPSEEATRIAFLEDIRAGLQNAGQGSYVNYCDTLIKDYGNVYYRSHYQKLQQIKQQYDPSNLFAYAQSIKPKG